MKYLIVISALTVALFLTACQPFEARFADVRDRLNALEGKGLPDSVIAPVRLSLVAAEGHRARNRGSDANKALREGLAAVVRAEDFLENSLSVKLPEIRKRRDALAARVNSDLRGLHKQSADSILQQIDSLLDIKFVFRAERVVKQMEDNFPRKQRSQHLADSIRPLINGTVWTYTERTTHAHDKNVNAVENKTFRFNRDGTAYFEERKQGQSAPNLRENYRFETWGTWDMRGDTIHILANRFTQHRQEFWQLNELTGRWGHINTDRQFIEGRANVIPAETLTMAVNPEEVVLQNRFIAYSDLLNEFTRQRQR